MGTIMEFRGICRKFGDLRVVQDLSLCIEEGTIFSLLGPSGCGKTTLLRLAAGFLEPDAGQILLDGVDITQLPPNKRHLNTIFQSYALFPHLTVRANIGFGPKMAGWTKQRINHETDRLLDLVQLSDHGHKKPEHLSGGQKQRVALARALILQPRVLLLDEPFSALDLKLRQRMLLELERLQREVGITFVFVTHDQHEAMSISHQIAVMNQGRLEQCGSPTTIYQKPESRFVATFIGDTNLIHGMLKTGGGYSSLIAQGLPPIAVKDFAADDTEVVLSIRPEKMRLGPEPPSGMNALPGRITSRVYLGSQTRYMIDVDGRRFVAIHTHARGAEEDLPQSGDQVWLSWQVGDGVVLPHEPEALEPES